MGGWVGCFPASCATPSRALAGPPSRPRPNTRPPLPHMHTHGTTTPHARAGQARRMELLEGARRLPDPGCRSGSASRRLTACAAPLPPRCLSCPAPHTPPTTHPTHHTLHPPHTHTSHTRAPRAPPPLATTTPPTPFPPRTMPPSALRTTTGRRACCLPACLPSRSCLPACPPAAACRHLTPTLAVTPMHLLTRSSNPTPPNHRPPHRPPRTRAGRAGTPHAAPSSATGAGGRRPGTVSACGGRGGACV